MLLIWKQMGSFFVSLRLPLDKISCTRQFESKLSLRSFAKSLAKRRVFRKPTRLSLPLKKEFLLPLRLSCKESSTFLTKPLFPQEREDVTALRCSEPLRSMVGGASKPSPCFAGWDRLTITLLKAGMGKQPHFSTFKVISSPKVKMTRLAFSCSKVCT